MKPHFVSLDGPWALRFGPQVAGGPATPKELAESDWPQIPATVPGNVELDLLAAGRIADPAVGDHIFALRAYEAHEWWYSRAFQAARPPDGGAAELVFEGLDCIATVWLNGVEVGRADNMFIAHRFDVTGALRDGPNELVVRLGSAVLEGRKHVPDAYEHAMGVNWEAQSVRKAPHMYGWDIMPRLVSAGIWRGVRLELPAPTRFRSVYWATQAADPAGRTARLLVDWDFATDNPSVDGWSVRVRLSRPGGGACVHESRHACLGVHGRATLELADVDLWWPRGSGPAALYDIEIELLDANAAARARHDGRVGLRTVRLVRTPVTTQAGEGEFVFVVNGEKVFVKGTNWVPLDALHSRDAQHVAPAVEMLAELNCNMVRCWGGNVYEDRAFFDLCDERGIMVWQDFAMACAVYPQTDEFAARIAREAEAVVRKLRNHACLALWAGNNEIDVVFPWTGTGQDPNTERISRQVLPAVVRRLDPHRDYLPSSPYVSPEMARGDGPGPEDHLWGPRDDFKGPFYMGSPAHFVSEIGYHGCPGRASIERMMGPGHAWPQTDNPHWLAKSASPHRDHHDYDYRIELMSKQIAVLFGRVPDTLDEFALASQVVQAEALKFFLDRWRSGKWRRTGILWWNLRDGWPVVSDAIVDYYGRRKLAYEYVRREHADVCVIVGEAEEGRHRIFAVNDTRAPAAGRASLRDADSDALLWEGDFHVDANGRSSVGQIVESAGPALWLIDWTLSDGTPGRSHYLPGPRPVDLADYRRWLAKLDIPPGVGP